MNQSNTPRTDAAYMQWLREADSFDSIINHARQLETELADATKRADELADALRQIFLASSLLRIKIQTTSPTMVLFRDYCRHTDAMEKAQQTLAKFDQMKGKL